MGRGGGRGEAVRGTLGRCSMFAGVKTKDESHLATRDIKYTSVNVIA